MRDDHARLGSAAVSSLPSDKPDIIEWAEEHVQFPSSARSKHFNISVSPWLAEPMRRAVDLSTRIITFMKPVQSGGSSFGEVVLMYWAYFWNGFLQYNWSNDKRAVERWDSRIEATLKACAPLAARMEQAGMSKCEVDFGNVFFRMQGAFVSDNLDSDSVRLQINEEVHAWEPGHLKKARNRSTAVWNFKSIDISNAGDKGDQLDQAFKDGTMQPWIVRCPGCGLYHRMRTKWDDKRPDLGGLRYDADGCRRGHFEYDYNKLRPTIHFQMPCGAKVHNEDMMTRRALSSSGKYDEPTNKNAELSHRSYTYESVNVDYIDWMQLIKDKHDALRARSLGNPQPWRRYKCERECIPYDPDDVPLLNINVVTQGVKKNREGLAAPKLRLFSLDRQQGEKAKGEFPYWWLLIRDVKIENGKLRSRLVYEDRLETDEQVIAVLNDHQCNMWQGVADSGDDTTHVYLFCIQHGINAIKGGKEDFYVHEGGARRIFSPERPLHVMLNRKEKYPYVEVDIGGGQTQMMPDPREPMFWLYSKSGIRERLHWLRSETLYETPEDVSEDYKSHNEAEERVEVISPTDGTRSWRWVQHKTRNDQMVNEAYVAMQIDQAGMILGTIAKTKTEKEK